MHRWLPVRICSNQWALFAGECSEERPTAYCFEFLLSQGKIQREGVKLGWVELSREGSQDIAYLTYCVWGL